jgi:hypothetical protein
MIMALFPESNVDTFSVFIGIPVEVGYDSKPEQLGG